VHQCRKYSLLVGRVVVVGRSVKVEVCMGGFAVHSITQHIAHFIAAVKLLILIVRYWNALEFCLLWSTTSANLYGQSWREDRLSLPPERPNDIRIALRSSVCISSLQLLFYGRWGFLKK
jgi:hypothetical protein